MSEASSGPGRAVLFDYGGVLTDDIRASFAFHEHELSIPPGRCVELLVADSRGPGGGPIGGLERGELAVEDFEARLRELLVADGHAPAAEDVTLERFLARLRPTGGLWEVAARARAAGVTTGLLSNSWGLAMYPRERLDRYFDVQVISGEVGLRKPHPGIFRLALERAGVPARRCAFVDDLSRNVEVARDLGLFAVHHSGDEAATARSLSSFLGFEVHAA